MQLGGQKRTYFMRGSFGIARLGTIKDEDLFVVIAVVVVVVVESRRIADDGRHCSWCCCWCAWWFTVRGCVESIRIINTLHRNRFGIDPINEESIQINC